MKRMVSIYQPGLNRHLKASHGGLAHFNLETPKTDYMLALALPEALALRDFLTDHLNGFTPAEVNAARDGKSLVEVLTGKK